MKRLLSPELLPDNAVLFLCSSHEERCEALARFRGSWVPKDTILFRYDHPNPTREIRHRLLREHFAAISRTTEVSFSQRNPAESMTTALSLITRAIPDFAARRLVIDISVFTKRHLLMILQWLTDCSLLTCETIYLYAEPLSYTAVEHIQLSSGLSSLREVPGFPAVTDPSRPLSLAILLGYEGGRALAAFELIQPEFTLLFVPHPPFRSEWAGRTELLNAELIRLLGTDNLRPLEPLDPVIVFDQLIAALGNPSTRGHRATLICPLGPKPQVLGAFRYLNACEDKPAIVYADPLRHNQRFSTSGIARIWVLGMPV